MQLSAIVPCYNYKDYILKNIEKLNDILKQKFKTYEIIIINDGSYDETRKVLKKLVNRNNINIIHNKVNKGKSYSIIRGIKKAKGKKILLYDCDLPYFKYLKYFLNKLKKQKLVIIDRKNKKSKLIKNINIYQKIRQTIGVIISYLVCWYLKIEIVDTQAGLKGFDNIKILKKKKFISEKFFLDLEIIHLFKKKGIHPFKIPVKYQAPNKSTIKLFDFKNIIILNELFRVLISLNKN